jgi:hypothetical protein
MMKNLFLTTMPVRQKGAAHCVAKQPLCCFSGFASMGIVFGKKSCKPNPLDAVIEKEQWMLGTKEDI